jgi:hypothetical protein
MAETKYETFDVLMKITEENLQPVAIHSEKTIFDLDPNACEVVRRGDAKACFNRTKKWRWKKTEAAEKIINHEKGVKPIPYRQSKNPKYERLQG